MSDDTITLVEVQETQYGEKVVIDSPYETKEWISNLPWKEYSEEVAEHGSLQEKAEDRGINTKTSELIDVFAEMETYGFSPDLATHNTWDPNALDGSGAWTIDLDAVEEVIDFWEFAGLTVEVSNEVEAALE